MNQILKFLNAIVPRIQSSIQQLSNTLSEKEQLAIVKAQISVMRDKMAEQNTTYDKMTNRMFTLLGTQIAISGLFTSSLVAIPYPATHAGKIIFYGAISLIGLSVLVLIINYRTTKIWPSPMGPSEVIMMNMADSELAALQILYADYRLAYDQAGDVIRPRAKYLNTSLLLFVVGAILLLVLKFGG